MTTNKANSHTGAILHIFSWLNKALYHIAVFIVIGAKGDTTAQTFPTDFRTEQIMLTTDRGDYNLSDTIRVNGLVTSLASGTSLPYSRIVYLELIDPKADSVIVRHKNLCNTQGRFSDIIIPEPDLAKGDYFLRAYTRFMLNFSKETLPLHNIKIGARTIPDDGIIDDNVSCLIYPSGGKIITGTPQQIVGILSNHLGYRMAGADLALVSEHGDTIETQRTTPSGYAVFNFIPQRGENYKIRFSRIGIEKEFGIPGPDEKACKITAVIKDTRLRFALEGEIPPQKRLFVFDRCNGLSEITMNGQSGTVNLGLKQEGPISLFLTDGNLDVVSEYSIMSDQAPYSDNIVTAPDSVKKGEQINYRITGLPTDSIIYMARMVPVRINEVMTAPVALQLTSNYKSELPFPVLNGSIEDFRNDMRTWLSTASFALFDIAEAASSNKPIYTIMPEQYISISGTVYDDKKAKHPMKGGNVIAYNGTNRSVTDAEIGRDGRFRLHANDFVNGTEFFIQAYNNKGLTKEWIIKIDDEHYPPIGILPEIGKQKGYYGKATTSIGDNGNGSRMLPDVTVKTEYIRREEHNDKKYYGARFKDRDDFEKHSYKTLLDVLRDMPFIRVQKVSEAFDDRDEAPKTVSDLNNAGFNTYYIIVSTRTPTSLSGSGAKIPLFIDGVLTDTKLASLTFDMVIEDIESVEHLNVAEAMKYTAQYPFGIINVTTRKPGPEKTKDSKGTRCWPKGLERLEHTSEQPIYAPNESGDYLLWVDMITYNGNVMTLKRPIKVTD